MSAVFADDLITIMEGAAVGTRNVNLLSGLASDVPEGDGPFLSVIETGGSGPDYIQNQAAPAYIYPTAQLVSRAGSNGGPDSVAARAFLVAARGVLVVVRNQTIDGTRYLWIRPLNEPLEMPPVPGDDRARWSTNIVAHREA